MDTVSVCYSLFVMWIEGFWKTYYSWCMFRFYVVVSLLSCLFEGLFCSFQSKIIHQWNSIYYSEAIKQTQRQKRHNIPHRSCSRYLFSLFHSSLKSDENSCHAVKNVLGETSFSPALGLTEKNTLSSTKLESIQRKAWHYEQNITK